MVKVMLFCKLQSSPPPPLYILLSGELARLQLLAATVRRRQTCLLRAHNVQRGTRGAGVAGGAGRPLMTCHTPCCAREPRRASLLGGVRQAGPLPAAWPAVAALQEASLGPSQEFLSPATSLREASREKPN